MTWQDVSLIVEMVVLLLIWWDGRVMKGHSAEMRNHSAESVVIQRESLAAQKQYLDLRRKWYEQRNKKKEERVRDDKAGALGLGTGSD